jgi:hypothetical protein
VSFVLQLFVLKIVLSVGTSLQILSQQCSSEWSISGTWDLWQMSEFRDKKICGDLQGGA